MLKSIRNGGRRLASCPASTTAIEGINASPSFSPNGYRRTSPSDSMATLTSAGHDWLPNGFRGGLMEAAPPFGAGWLKDGRMVEPPASRSALTKASSEAGSDG